MGLDCRIFIAKSTKGLDDFDYCEWEDIQDICDDDFASIMRPCQVWYARKFWGLIENLSFLKGYENGQYVQIHKKDLKEMIEYYAFHEDYFEKFNGLPRLCELYRDFDRIMAAGLNLYFEGDW